MVVRGARWRRPPMSCWPRPSTPRRRIGSRPWRWSPVWVSPPSRRGERRWIIRCCGRTPGRCWLSWRRGRSRGMPIGGGWRSSMRCPPGHRRARGGVQLLREADALLAVADSDHPGAEVLASALADLDRARPNPPQRHLGTGHHLTRRRHYRRPGRRAAAPATGPAQSAQARSSLVGTAGTQRWTTGRAGYFTTTAPAPRSR